jgi:DNA-binding LacI/PurR family transcriptional regulator
MITAREIAAIVGVSVSTVGRALADDPRISEETRTKVRKAADRAGYAGNLAARMVRGGASNLIGLLVPEVSNDFYSTIAQSLSEVCGRQGYRLVLSLTRDDKDDESRNIRELVAAQAAGIIIVPTPAPRRASLQLLKQVPHVQLLRKVNGAGDVWFGIDDGASFEEAVRHLTMLGHRRIAYIGGEGAFSTGEARLEGFIRGCLAAGIGPEDYISRVGAPTQSFGTQVCAEIMGASEPPTAVVSGAFNITIGIIEWIEANGVSVDEMPSIVGFGDPEWFKWWRGGLTTIRPPVENLATSCALWFLNQLSDRREKKSDLPPHSVVVSSSLVLRASTKPPRKVPSRRRS